MPVGVSADQSQPKENSASYVPDPRSARTVLSTDGSPRLWKNLRVSGE